MDKAAAIFRDHADQTLDALRVMLVSACGVALVLAGHASPF